MKRELLNSKLIFEYEIDEEFNIDTLLLKDFVRIKAKHKTLLEIGTSSGAISLYLSNHNILIDAIEIQESRALRALSNVKINNLENKINVINADVRTYSFNRLYDVIVSNPPFFKYTNKEITPRLIGREEVYLTLEDLCKVINKNLKELGEVFLIYPVSRFNELFILFNKYRLTIKKIRFIYPNVNAKPNRVLIHAIKGAKEELIIEKNFYLYNIDKSISDELNKIYGKNNENN